VTVIILFFLKENFHSFVTVTEQVEVNKKFWQEIIRLLSFNCFSLPGVDSKNRKLTEPNYTI